MASHGLTIPSTSWFDQELDSYLLGHPNLVSTLKHGKKETRKQGYGYAEKKSDKKRKDELTSNDDGAMDITEVNPDEK